LNHGLDTDVTKVSLSKPLGRRMQGFLLALLTVAVVSQAPMFAKEPEPGVDCVGNYEKEVGGYFNDMLGKVAEANQSYGWFNPMRTIMINAAGVEYYAKAESAFFQMLACSAIPVK
jgi:hypothetical protein